MNVIVCCPSYRRPKVETLDYLPFCRVYVDHNEALAYREKNPGADIVSCPEGIQGNLCRVRNYMLDREFKDGADVVCIIDDDMRLVSRYEPEGFYGYNRIPVTQSEFVPMIQEYSRLCREWGFYFWGINCNFDPLSYKHYTPFSTVAYIGGPFQVHLNNPIRYDESLPLKEDYDISLQHCCRNRGVLRVNKYHYLAKQATQIGGCATYRTNDREKEQFALLQRKWGTRIVKTDKQSKREFDFNPILFIPIRGL